MKRMKRLLAIVLLLLVAFPMTALAYTPFTLRNGYYWGMPKEEIFALAQEEGLGPNTSKGERAVAFQSVPVGDFFAEMSLGLDEAFQLNYILYLFPSVPKDQLDQLNPMFNALTQALTDVYGPFDPIFSDFLTWELRGTRIVLTIMPDWGNDELQQCSISYEPKTPVQNSGF